MPLTRKVVLGRRIGSSILPKVMNLGCFGREFKSGLMQTSTGLWRDEEIRREEVCVLSAVAGPTNDREHSTYWIGHGWDSRPRIERVLHTKLSSIWHQLLKRTVKLIMLHTKFHSRISGGSSALICATRSGTPGMAVIIFIDTKFPAACTPASVRAARWKLTLAGLSALSCETAPALTSAANSVPSMVRTSF